MRGLPSITCGMALLGLTGWILYTFGNSAAVLFCGSAGVILLLRGLHSAGVAAAGPAATLAQFATNPRDTILDGAIDKAGDIIGERRRRQVTEDPAFDADAAFARYMANRPDPIQESAKPAATGFGRKQI